MFFKSKKQNIFKLSEHNPTERALIYNRVQNSGFSRQKSWPYLHGKCLHYVVPRSMKKKKKKSQHFRPLKTFQSLLWKLISRRQKKIIMKLKKLIMTKFIIKKKSSSTALTYYFKVLEMEYFLNLSKGIWLQSKT